MNAHYECNRAPVVRKCGTAFHNAMLDVSGPMLDSRAPGCKLNVKKIISSAGKVVSSFIVLGIGLVSARFYIILLP